jgi:hypothetical protein
MATAVERLQFLLTMDSSGAIKGFKNVGNTADKELGKAKTGLDKLSYGLTRTGAGAIAMATVLGGGLIKAAVSFEHAAIAAGKFSDATGMSIEQSSRWIVVARQTSTDATALQTAFTKLDRAIGKSPEKFAEFGIEIAKNSRGATDVNQTFLNMVDRLNSIPDPAKRAEIAATLMGRGWQATAELIAKGSGYIGQALSNVDASQVFDAGARSKAEQMRKAMVDLGNAGKDLQFNLAQGAIPVISTLAHVLSTGIKGFSELNVVSHGSVGAFASVATAALGAGGAVSLAAGQFLKLKERFITTTEAGTSVLSGFGKMAIGLGAVTAALTIGSMAWEAATKKKREAAARTAEVSKALGDEVMNLIHEKNAVDGARVGFEALSNTLTTVGKDGTKLSTAMGELGLTNRDAAQTLADFKLSGDKGYETLRKLAVGAGVGAGAADRLAAAISANDVQFEDSAFKAMGLTDAHLSVAHALMEVRDQAQKTDIFKDMNDAIWKMASSGTAGQKALKKVNDEIGSGTDKATVAERYKRLSTELYGLPDAANAAAGGVGEIKDPVYESGKAVVSFTDSIAALGLMTASQIPVTDMLNGLFATEAAKTKAAADMTAYLAEELDKNTKKTLDAIDAEAAYADSIVASKEVVKTYNQAIKDAKGDQDKINAANADAVKQYKDLAAPIVDLEKSHLHLKDAQDEAAASALLTARYFRNEAKDVGIDSPLGKALIEHATLLENIKPEVKTRVLLEIDKVGYGMPGLITGAKAGGGPVSAGGTYLVGEKGPELLTMGSSSGSITPNNALGGAGNTFNIHVSAPQGQDPYTWGQAIVKAIKAFERTNGPVFKAA